MSIDMTAALNKRPVAPATSAVTARLKPGEEGAALRPASGPGPEHPRASARTPRGRSRRSRPRAPPRRGSRDKPPERVRRPVQASRLDHKVQGPIREWRLQLRGRPVVDGTTMRASSASRSAPSWTIARRAAVVRAASSPMPQLPSRSRTGTTTTSLPPGRSSAARWRRNARQSASAWRANGSRSAPVRCEGQTWPWTPSGRAPSQCSAIEHQARDTCSAGKIRS